MICTDAQLELAQNIKEVTNNPLLKTEGDNLVCAAKLIFGDLFEKAAQDLQHFHQSQKELAGKSEDGFSNIAKYHCHVAVAVNHSYLNQSIGDLAFVMLREGHLDRSTKPSGIWALCKMIW